MLIGIGSVKGSPGVTSAAVALTAALPAALAAAAGGPVRALLVEADPAGGDLAMRFALMLTPGLMSLAADARRGDRVDPTHQIDRHAQPLPPPVGVAVVVAPPDAHQARAAIAALAGQVPGDVRSDARGDVGGGFGVLRAAADLPGRVVVVDCGRLDPGSPTAAVLHGADALVMLARPHAEELAHLVRRLPEFRAWARHPALVLTGPGHRSAEVAQELGVAVLARLPHDPAAARLLSAPRGGGITRRRRFEHSALGRAVGQLAADLVELTGVGTDVIAPGVSRHAEADRAAAAGAASVGAASTAARPRVERRRSGPW